MADIVGFLRARLDEDEAIASAVAGGPDMSSAEGGIRWGSDIEGVPAGTWHFCCRFTPERAQAEIAAKREIVRLLDQYDYLDPMPDIDGHYGSPSTPVLVARQLALPYADHPNYEQEWC